jgi:hypothetical protein
VAGGLAAGAWLPSLQQPERRRCAENCCLWLWVRGLSFSCRLVYGCVSVSCRWLGLPHHHDLHSYRGGAPGTEGYVSVNCVDVVNSPTNNLSWLSNLSGVVLFLLRLLVSCSACPRRRAPKATPCLCLCSQCCSAVLPTAGFQAALCYLGSGVGFPTRTYCRLSQLLGRDCPECPGRLELLSLRPPILRLAGSTQGDWRSMWLNTRHALSCGLPCL